MDPSRAADPQPADATVRLSPALEAEYRASQLFTNRTLIRISCLLALLATLFRAVDNIFGGAWSQGSPGGSALALFGFVACGSLVLVWLAWSRAFERWYLPTARIVVPARNVIVAALVAAAVVRGERELLMIMPLLVLGPFFFLGLSFRAALVSVVLTVAAYFGAAIMLELPQQVLMRSSVFLFLTVVACAIAARALEKSSRKSFHDSRLIAELAQYDALTGTRNRRIFDEHFSRLWRQAIDDSRTLVIALIDVDHFKAYNDRYGHQAGDETLRRVAQTLQTFVSRPLDVLGRYGGEEFAIVLYDTQQEEALELANRMRTAVSDLAIEHRGSQTARVITVSIGLAVIKPTDARRSRGALQLADEALYEAKVRGRNQVALKSGAEYDMLVTGAFSRSTLTGQP